MAGSEPARAVRPPMLARARPKENPDVPDANLMPGPAALLFLQRQAGNRAVTMALGTSRSNRSVQRLSVTETRWDDATEAHITSGGKVGAAIVREEGATPVVVKANEAMTSELMIASNLANALGTEKKKKKKGYSFSAPQARTASGEKSQRGSRSSFKTG